MLCWLRWRASRRRNFGSALDRLVRQVCCSGRVCRRTRLILFKHALVQDAAYGTLLREPRRALHARIAETLENQFAEIAENQPELLARHCTDAGLIEKAAALWGKAGQRSLARSALVEAVEQLTRALDQIATLPATPALRREQIKLQVALITPLIHVKGYAAPETKAAAERARLLIEQAEAIGEPPEDHCCYSRSFTASGSRITSRSTATWCASLRRSFWLSPRSKERLSPLMIGHRLMGMSLLVTGEIARRPERTTTRRLRCTTRPSIVRWQTRFGQDVRMRNFVLSAAGSVATWLS